MTIRSSTWVLALASVASCMTALDTLVVATSLTTIRLDLGASVEQLEWTVNAYNLSFAVLLMTAAALGDRFGRRRMFAAGIALFSLASAACALAPTVGWLIAARTVQGAGGALVMTLALALVGTAVLVAAFVAWELRARAPMLPMRFFRARSFSAGNAAIFFAVGSLFCGVFFLAQFMQAGLGRGPLAAGLGLLPWTATLFFVAPVAGTLVDRLGERPFMVLGPLLQAVGMGWLALIAEADMPYGRMIAPLMVAGVGISMSFPAAQTAVVGAVPAEAIGKATGTNTTLRELGGVFGIALSVAFFGAAGGYGSPTEFTDGFVAVMGVAAGLSVLAVCAGLMLPAGGRLGAPATVGVDR